MLNPKDQSELEQAIASMKEIWPQLWKNIYDGCIEQNFTEPQSFELLKTYIISQGIKYTKE